MRIRIVNPMAGILDGHSLSALIPETVYEVNEHLGIQLIALYGAVEDHSDALAVSLDTPETAFDVLPDMTGGVHILHHERRKKPRP